MEYYLHCPSSQRPEKRNNWHHIRASKVVLLKMKHGILSHFPQPYFYKVKMQTGNFIKITFQKPSYISVDWDDVH